MISAAKLMAKCIASMNEADSRQDGCPSVAKQGKVAAVLAPPPDHADATQPLHGFMRGSVLIPTGVDLTAPTLEEPLDAASGIMHR